MKLKQHDIKQIAKYDLLWQRNDPDIKTTITNARMMLCWAIPMSCSHLREAGINQ